jgi:hypothetical protein
MTRRSTIFESIHHDQPRVLFHQTLHRYHLHEYLHPHSPLSAHLGLSFPAKERAFHAERVIIRTKPKPRGLARPRPRGGYPREGRERGRPIVSPRQPSHPRGGAAAQPRMCGNTTCSLRIIGEHKETQNRTEIHRESPLQKNVFCALMLHG